MGWTRADTIVDLHKVFTYCSVLKSTKSTSTQLGFQKYLTSKAKGSSLEAPEQRHSAFYVTQARIKRPASPWRAHPSQDGLDHLLAAGDTPQDGAGRGAQLRAVLGLLQQLLLRLVQLLTESQFLLKPKQDKIREMDSIQPQSTCTVFPLLKTLLKK